MKYSFASRRRGSSTTTITTHSRHRPVLNIVEKPPKVLSSGTFGCAYKEGFDCHGKRWPDHWHVLTKAARDVDDREMVVSKLIRSIPQFKQYFAPVLRHCQPEEQVVKIVKRDCKVFDNRKDPMILMMMNFVGIYTWAAWIDQLAEGVHDHSIRRQVPYWRDRVSELIQCSFRLNRSLQLLREARVCHFDLKSNNIMMSDYGTRLPIVIDFGLSLPMDTVEELWAKRDWRLVDYFYNTSMDYPAWCFEIMLLSRLCADAAKRVRKQQIILPPRPEWKGASIVHTKRPMPPQPQLYGWKEEEEEGGVETAPHAFLAECRYEATIAPMIEHYFDNNYLQKSTLTNDQWKRAKDAFHEHYRQLPYETVEEWISFLLTTWKEWDVSAAGFILWESLDVWIDEPQSPAILKTFRELVLQHWVLRPHKRTLSLRAMLVTLRSRHLHSSTALSSNMV